MTYKIFAFAMVMVSFAALAFCALVYFFSYPLWWIFCLFAGIFYIPFLEAALRDTKSPVWSQWMICVFTVLPSSLAIAWFDGINWMDWAMAQIFLFLLWVEIFGVVQNKSSLFRERFFSISIVLMTAPYFLYHLYLEIWLLKLEWLLCLTPLGYFSHADTNFPAAFLPLLYPACYSLFERFRKLRWTTIHNTNRR